MNYNEYYQKVWQLRKKRRRNHRKKVAASIACVLAGVTLTGGIISAVLFLPEKEKEMDMQAPGTGITEAAIQNDKLYAEPETQLLSPAATPKIYNTVKKETSPSPEKEPEYDYSKPVPKSDPVDISWFDDSMFIGDSRTEGFIMNSGIVNAASYTYKGLSVETVFTEPVIETDAGTVSVMEAAAKTDFNKVYIMFGINETGWVSGDSFIQQYGKVIDSIREINPDADIYIQSVIPVSKEVSDNHDYVKNSRIYEYNGLIQKMAQEKNAYYVNVAECMADENGDLPADAAVDGIHMKSEYCLRWLDYLTSHTVN